MTLESIKTHIEERIGKQVNIKQKQIHRSKIIKYDGVIKAVYNNLFTVEVSGIYREKKKNITFNYRDILTKAIVMDFKGESD